MWGDPGVLCIKRPELHVLEPLAGISSETILKHSDISEEELLDLIDKLNSDHRVDGLLVQLPLPGKGKVGQMEKSLRLLIYKLPVRNVAPA